MADRIRIALCDDHAVVRSGLRRILEAEADLEVVGEAGSATQAVEVASSAQPDVFVMDLGLPDRNGIAATTEVCAVSPETRVLVLTVHDDVAYLRRAFAAGATGYLVDMGIDIPQSWCPFSWCPGTQRARMRVRVSGSVLQCVGRR